MNGICNLKNVVYQATIFQKENVKYKKIYIRISSVWWTLRYNNHIHSFSHECFRNQTALSKTSFKVEKYGFNSKNSMENIEKIYYS